MRDFVEKRERLTDPYITAGNRVYIIGTQDGDFPDLGGHIPGEMAGVWDHPIKLFDGFYVGIATPMGTIWPAVTAYRAYPFYTEHVSRAADYELIRRQFVPDHEEAAVITMTYTPLSPADKHRNLVFAVKSDLRPAWLSEDEDGRDTVDQHDGHLVFHDSLHPWTAMVGTSASTYAIHLGMNCPCLTQGQGTASCISIPLVCEPGQSLTVHMVLAGSVNGLEACHATLERVLTRIDELFDTKATRYEVMDRYTAVSVPDDAIASALRWVKYSTDWLVRTTDMGNGLGAGLPEYPWWFSCHNGYALEGVLTLGWFDLVKDTIRLLARVSDRHNGNGRIIHKVSTSGVVHNPGNVQVTPQFCGLVWEVFRWTGDMQFLEELYPIVKKGIEWTLHQTSMDEDFPVGCGINKMEHLNQRLIDAAVYMYAALDAGAKMAEVFGDALLSSLLRDRACKLHQDILRGYWLEHEGLFADAIATPRDMNPRLLGWAKRACDRGAIEAAAYYQGLVDESPHTLGVSRPYLLRQWIINTPLEQGLAHPLQADRALARMRTPEFTGPHGRYLSGTERRAMMTISTGLQAMAEARYGHVDEAVHCIRLIASTLNLRTAGSISEMSPDYGCFMQAWTVYGVYGPIVNHLFGISPAAHERACSLHPRMPSSWNHAALSQLRVGDNLLDFEYRRVNEDELITVHSALDWTIHFVCPVKPFSELDGESDAVRAYRLSAGNQVTFRLVNTVDECVFEK